jgi:hypothetical protein
MSCSSHCVVVCAAPGQSSEWDLFAFGAGIQFAQNASTPAPNMTVLARAVLGMLRDYDVFNVTAEQSVDVDSMLEDPVSTLSPDPEHRTAKSIVMCDM